MTVELIQSLFFTVVVAVYLYLTHLIYRATPRWRPLALTLLIWMVGVTLLAHFQFFGDFQSVPPRLPIFAAIAFSGMIYLVFFSSWKEALMRIPQRYLLRLQSFRIFVEVVLAGLASHRLLPAELSFHGRNYDIVAGAFALLLARIVLRDGEVASRRKIIGYNAAGLLLLTNVVVQGMLSTPYPWRLFHFDPPNAILAFAPFHLLPLFLVPVAYLLHIVSLRRALRIRSETETLERPGVGMAPLETLISRYVLMPRLWKNRSVDEGMTLFRNESDRILERIASAKDPSRLKERVLVRPLVGLEDSSRNWSVTETLEHLETTAGGMADIGIALSQGKTLDFKVDTALVKPKGKLGTPESFRAAMTRIQERLKKELGPHLEKPTHPHPWFGPMNAREWILLLGMHQGIHRRQVEGILQGSMRGDPVRSPEK